MKISELCARTGVSDKTVRFYIEKGLLKKKAILVNGRNCREYEEEDVCILRDIVTLRNVGFSIQDISDMQREEADIERFVEKRLLELKKEEEKCQQLNQRLQKLTARKISSWRKVASLLQQETSTANEEIVMRWPAEEDVIEKERLSLGAVLRRIAVVAGIVILLFLVYFYYQSLQMNSCTFPIGDVTFHEKWNENGKMYVSLSCTGEQLWGYDFLFSESQTVEVKDHQYYSALMLEEVSYQSVTLQIEMTKSDAYWEGVLVDEQDYLWMDVEKILEDDTLIKKYCKLVAIYSE